MNNKKLKIIKLILIIFLFANVIFLAYINSKNHMLDKDWQTPLMELDSEKRQVMATNVLLLALEFLVFGIVFFMGCVIDYDDNPYIY